MNQYSETNTVGSLVIYEWSVDIDLFAIRDLFEDIAGVIGRPPDIATLLDDKIKGRDYLYKNFVKRDLIHKKEWDFLGYLWKRNETLSDFAIDISCETSLGKRLEFHVDQAAVESGQAVMKSVADLIVEKLLPVYGIGFAMPYYWGPRAFGQGSVSTRYATVDKTIYGPPEWIKERSWAFRETFIADAAERGLDAKIRDVFELNFLSEGHLNRRIEGMSLRDWIGHTNTGTLRQLNDVTWQWRVPEDLIEEARRPLIDAGITVLRE